MTKTWTKRSGQILEEATNLQNYNRWIISLFKNDLKGKIIEIGSGLGGLSVLLPKKTTVLSDINNAYLEILKSGYGYKTIKLNITKKLSREYINTFDTILSSNVFEHIENDQEAFNNCYKLLKHKGELLLFVPARQEIFGVLDKEMGHFRRYTTKEITQKAKKSGFKIIIAKYVNLPGYFTWWARGRLKSNSQQDTFFAKIFDKIITPFLALEKFYTPPFGQSLILIAKKK